MTDIALRQAGRADSTAVETCVNAAYELYVERMGQKPAPMLADYGSLIDRGLVWVVAGDSEIRGLIVCEPRDDHLFVENVAVHPGYQGHGLGRRLMQFAEDQARQHGLAAVRLYTNELMTENLEFYARLDYQVIDRRLEAGYRRIYLRKTLPESHASPECA